MIDIYTLNETRGLKARAAVSSYAAIAGRWLA
jgi:hypothetical protein